MLSEWFDEYENDVNHMLWYLQTPDLNPTDNQIEILEESVCLKVTIQCCMKCLYW